MQELESLLAKYEMSIGFKFNHLKHHVQYYAHIINIYSSHIISSMTFISKQYLSDLEVLFNTDHMFHAKDDDNLDNGNINVNKVVAKLQLDSCYNACGDAKLEEWFSDIKCNPLKHAHRVICLLHSSDQYKECFHEFVQAGNE